MPGKIEIQKYDLEAQDWRTVQTIRDPMGFRLKCPVGRFNIGIDSHHHGEIRQDYLRLVESSHMTEALLVRPASGNVILIRTEKL